MSDSNSDFLDISIDEEDLAPPAFQLMPTAKYQTRLIGAELKAEADKVQVIARFGTAFHEIGNGAKTHNRAKGKRFAAWHKHPSAEAQRIGQTDLVRLAQAYGLATVTEGEGGKKKYGFPPQTTVAEFVEQLNALTSQDVGVFVKQENRTRNKQVVYRTDDPTKPIVDENIKSVFALDTK